MIYDRYTVVLHVPVSSVSAIMAVLHVRSYVLMYPFLLHKLQVFYFKYRYKKRFYSYLRVRGTYLSKARSIQFNMEQKCTLSLMRDKLFV